MEDDAKRQIRELLLRRRKELEQVIKDELGVLQAQLAPDPSGQPRVHFNHPADALEGKAGDPDYEKALDLFERERAELALVDQALVRLAAGDYGVCDACGGLIPLARLLALPYADRCVSCQEKLERPASRGASPRKSPSPGIS